MQINRISDSSCKKSCLRIAMSQMEAELKFPHVQNSQSRVVASLTHIANCPSNVRWRRLQTVARQLVHDLHVSSVFEGPPVRPSSLQLFHYPPWRSTRTPKPGKARLPKIKSSEHPFHCQKRQLHRLSTLKLALCLEIFSKTTKPCLQRQTLH